MIRAWNWDTQWATCSMIICKAFLKLFVYIIYKVASNCSLVVITWAGRWRIWSESVCLLVWAQDCLHWPYLNASPEIRPKASHWTDFIYIKHSRATIPTACISEDTYQNIVFSQSSNAVYELLHHLRCNVNENFNDKGTSSSFEKLIHHVLCHWVSLDLSSHSVCKVAFISSFWIILSLACIWWGDSWK